MGDEISQRDLRMRSREIMDAVERGESFTVTRDGREIGELIPMRKRRSFVARSEFAAMSRTAPAIDLERFRADQDAIIDATLDDPYAR
ncbi:type II toxin-antitoxin system Phd/YefM family antitoxin [Agromyces sp. ZXT2-6]|uniref:type II toxin-antitoxin system Phd/YefM family antitoxin n=1 Tax=Agromyces sp. ZXT2-6 TaxID=3461153 RepID=UPI004054E56A